VSRVLSRSVIRALGEKEQQVGVAVEGQKAAGAAFKRFAVPSTLLRMLSRPFPAKSLPHCRARFDVHPGTPGTSVFHCDVDVVL
jgi:hypothetical protein